MRRAEGQRLGVAGMAHACALAGTSPSIASSRPGQRTSFSAKTTSTPRFTRRLRDEVDRRSLDLDEVDVSVGAREILGQRRAVREVARHADDVGVEAVDRPPGRS